MVVVVMVLVLVVVIVVVVVGRHVALQIWKQNMYTKVLDKVSCWKSIMLYIFISFIWEKINWQSKG